MNTYLVMRASTAVISALCALSIGAQDIDITDRYYEPIQTEVVSEDINKKLPEEVEIITENAEVPSEDITVNAPIEPVQHYAENDAIDIAKVMYRECGGLGATEQACVAWCILNRVDATGDSISSVIRAPYQFAFKEATPVRDDLLTLAKDVLSRWNREKNGETNVGRVLPKEYKWFQGDGKHNHFRNAYKGNYKIYDFNLSSPYDS